MKSICLMIHNKYYVRNFWGLEGEGLIDRGFIPHPAPLKNLGWPTQGNKVFQWGFMSACQGYVIYYIYMIFLCWCNVLSEYDACDVMYSGEYVACPVWIYTHGVMYSGEYDACPVWIYTQSNITSIILLYSLHDIIFETPLSNY